MYVLLLYAKTFFYTPNVCLDLQSPKGFLDVVSIHQTDPALMERGIYGLGGFLQVSQELRVSATINY